MHGHILLFRIKPSIMFALGRILHMFCLCAVPLVKVQLAVGNILEEK